MIERIGEYEIRRMVGKGGLGSVYEAFLGEERFALKLLNRTNEDSVASRRLAREYRELRLVDHPNVVRVIETGVHEDRPFLVMEFVEGSPLRRYLDVRRQSEATILDLEYSGTADESITASLDHEPEPGTSSEKGVAAAWLLGDDEPDSLQPVRPTAEIGGPPAPLPPDLRAKLNDRDRITRLRHVVGQMCDGLAFIHARGLVHRDVKPSNVLIDESGVAKLVDFGLVKSTLSSGNTTAAGRVVGTYRYMSPEQARGARVDGRSDLYSLGCLTYEMLCGRAPFIQQQTPDLLHAIVYQSPPPIHSINPGADVTLVTIAEKLLHKNPQARPSSAVDVARRLRNQM